VGSSPITSTSRNDKGGQGASRSEDLPAPSDAWTYNLAFNSMGDVADAVDKGFT
jgi:hypothetical protein